MTQASLFDRPEVEPGLDGLRTQEPIWWPAIGEGPSILRPYPKQGWLTATRPILGPWEKRGDGWYRCWQYPTQDTRPDVVRAEVVAASAEWVPRNPWNGWVVRWHGEREPVAVVSDLADQAKAQADAGLARWHLDRSQAFRRLSSLEREHPGLTSSLEVGPHGAARRVWRWQTPSAA